MVESRGGGSEAELQTLEVSNCRGYELGFSIGKRFSGLIKSRVAKDQLLQTQLRPFADTPQGHSLVEALSASNRNRYPTYWDELLGTAEGSGASLLDIILMNLRKETLPFIPTVKQVAETEANSDCSDVLVLSDKLAIVAHNEDAATAIIGHFYLVRATLPSGVSFTAYTYAGELPSGAFGFNSHGLAFTLDSVPPMKEEIVAGGIGRNFVSRDLLEATGIDDALQRIREPSISVGHCYNLVDIRSRKILNVEAASCNRMSVYEVGPTPFFHANMYLHLPIKQAQDENSISRQARAAQLSKQKEEDILSLLGDSTGQKFPIYMEGPTLKTSCTVLIDVDKRTLSILQGNPKDRKVSHVFCIS
ncbi:hypothetical protein EJ110_NYTH10757 [Nymphaea thermarum]|nr:hypothetical protein EJ110_NYTH10757 [Nymphaea thermarum]